LFGREPIIKEVEERRFGVKESKDTYS